MIFGRGSKTKGATLTNIHPAHRGEASNKSVQLVERNAEEKRRAAEGGEKVQPAAKPPGIQSSMDRKDFPDLGRAP
eukprot:7424520-Pyramimonas_sp.AAC.1